MKNTSPASNDSSSKRTFDFGIGGGFVAFTSYTWASTIVKEWGEKPSQRFGTVIGIALCFAVALLLVDYLFWRWRFDRAIRSGLWAGAAIGPYAGLVAWVELAHPVWSQVIGFASTVLVFLTFYHLDKRLQSNSYIDIEEEKLKVRRSVEKAAAERFRRRKG